MIFQGVIAGTSSGVGLWNTVTGETITELNTGSQKNVYRIINDYASGKVATMSDNVVTMWAHYDYI